MSNQIDDSIKRTMAFWYADGVAELCMGVEFLLLGAVLLVEGPAPGGSTLAAVMPALRYLAIIGGTIGIGVAMSYLKLNITYPRSGFVFYNKPPVKEMIPGIFGAVALALLLDQWIRVGMPEKLSWYIWLMAGLTVFLAICSSRLRARQGSAACKLWRPSPSFPVCCWVAPAGLRR